MNLDVSDCNEKEVEFEFLVVGEFLVDEFDEEEDEVEDDEEEEHNNGVVLSSLIRSLVTFLFNSTIFWFMLTI